MYSILAAILSFPFILSKAFAEQSVTIPVTSNPTATSVKFTGPFGNETVESVLTRLAGYATTVGASVATVMILYGAFQILTARGVSTQITAGRKTITYALGGLVIIILAEGLVKLFAALTRSLGV